MKTERLRTGQPWNEYRGAQDPWAGHLSRAAEPGRGSRRTGPGYGRGTEDASPASPADARTEVLVGHGRRTAPGGWRASGWGRRGLAEAPWSGRSGRGFPAPLRGIHLALLTALLAGGAVAAGLITTASKPASWPASVAVIEKEAAQACRNPDVASEPSQVNFACGKATRQVLWVFALLTSGGRARFADPASGRVGLEPITPGQGGEIAWSLNLHHPYDPYNPVDSLMVAARAINNIIGGATLTGPHGNPVVEPGLESEPANCLAYTGSSAVIWRSGFPKLCARPVTSPAGRARLVADVFRRWLVGASPQQARDAAVLFANATDPGNPRVQAILRQLRNRRLAPGAPPLPSQAIDRPIPQEGQNAPADQGSPPRPRQARLAAGDGAGHARRWRSRERAHVRPEGAGRPGVPGGAAGPAGRAGPPGRLGAHERLQAPLHDRQRGPVLPAAGQVTDAS